MRRHTTRGSAVWKRPYMPLRRRGAFTHMPMSGCASTTWRLAPGSAPCARDLVSGTAEVAPRAAVGRVAVTAEQSVVTPEPPDDRRR
jgi:hypothetical protein